MTIGGKIKWAREKRDWTVEQLTTETNLPKHRIWDIENGLNILPWDYELARIAKALYRDVGWFLDGKEPDDPVCLHCKLNENSDMSE